MNEQRSNKDFVNKALNQTGYDLCVNQNFLIYLQEHTVIESKPDHFLDDLRLNNPWPELRRSAVSLCFSLCLICYSSIMVINLFT